MTVREWITSRTPTAPAALSQQVLAALGGDADAPELRTSEVCLAAAIRSLEALLAANRFGRDSAATLLTVDALMTYAFEHASQTLAGENDLESFARRAAQALGQLTAQRV